MTTQSLPISKTKKDYYISAAVLVAIAASSVFAIYLTHPTKLKSNSSIDIFGLSIPNLQGAIMRQPRMSIVILLSIIILVTAFIFISREALPFFSRRIAWGSAVVAGVALLGVAFFTSDGRSGPWFRFVLLCLVSLAGSTLLAEIMIFYRKFIKDKDFKNVMWHRIVFAIVCACLVGLMSGSYYHFAMKDGAIIDYGSTNSINDISEQFQQKTPENPGEPIETVPTTFPALGD